MYTSTKTDPWYDVVATKADTQKKDTDEKEFAKIAQKKTTQVTKLKKCQNESKCANCGEGHKAGSKNCKIEIKERVIKKCKVIEEWEDKELFKSLK